MATKNVSSFAELKSAVEDTTTTEIIATEDITFSGGIKVNTTKSNIVIDFNNHTVTDNNSSSFTDTIYIASTTNIVSVTVKNAIWNGRNYYGVVGVYNGNTSSTINLTNITYTGPQFVYNKNGITNITDCIVLIDKNNSSTNPQEFCEANRVYINGNVKVTSNSTSDAVIWFTGTNATLTVEENANFEVTAALTYLLYTDSSPVMLFKQNSSTQIITRNGLFYASGSASHIASSFTLEENASFVAYKQDGNSIPMFKCLSNFSLKNNSTFRLYSTTISSTPLMYFGQTADIKIDSPKNVVLYNRGGNVFSFATGSTTNPNKISITTEMLRLWNVAKSPVSSAGDFTDTPTTQYHKQNYAEKINLTITASSSQILTAENNLEQQDIGYPLTTSIKLITSNVLSLGNVLLTVDEINDLSKAISGKTDTLSSVKVEYESLSFETTSLDTGQFSVSIENSLSVGTQVTISSNNNFLTKTLTFLSVGSVTITSLPSLKFNYFTEKSNKSLIFRQDPNFSIQIQDTRTSGGEWYLYAHINQPLTSENNKLENSLIFKEKDITKILSSTPILVYTGKWDKDSLTTTVKWNNENGFLLKIDPETTYNYGDYETELFWQITTNILN